MVIKTKKATFSLRTELIKEMDIAVSRGQAPSKNALVEQALVKALDDYRRQERLILWQEGASDPLLLKDMADTAESFEYSDLDIEKNSK